LSVICAAGGQHEHHTDTQTRSDGVIKNGVNHRQHFQMINDDLLFEKMEDEEPLKRTGIFIEENTMAPWYNCLKKQGRWARKKPYCLRLTTRFC